MHRVAKLVLLSGVVMLAACGPTKRSDSLTTTLAAYEHAVRWDGMNSAAVFIDPKLQDKQTPTPLQMQRYAQVTISGYDEGNGPVVVDQDHITQTVQIGVVNVHTQAERTIVDHQLWKYDEKTNHWWLESGLPDITQK